MEKKHITVIGAGFAGISAAAYLAKAGHNVTVVEKNEGPGGRARIFESEGYRFDMGPSWYWMPDTFDRFFNDFGFETSEFYELKRLDPSYRVYFSESEKIDLPAGESRVIQLFDELDPGSGNRLKKFLDEAEYKYEVGIREFVEKPGHSLFEFADLRVLNSLWRLDMLSSIAKNVKKVTSDPRLRQILEFPVLFLGAKPSKTPALYSLMNYADISLGTWYPMGGMYEIVKAMTRVAEAQGVHFKYNTTVEKVIVDGDTANRVEGNDWHISTDGVIAACDYNHFEQEILTPEYRRYSKDYWNKQTLAPSCLLYYVGVDKKIPELKHHNLFFDADFSRHAREIYDHPSWPSDPLFYICSPSQTDNTVAPDGHENLFILIPVAPGLDDTDEIRDKYFNVVMDRTERTLRTKIRPHIDHYRAFGTSNFIEDYYSFKGNAYGLANTLRQTAFLKPKMKAKEISNLMYAGQLTTPGPGVPPAIISGRVSARELSKALN
ncbi:MAG: phytoene desaturase family protein [Saprospiraceae bacterium]|nr:phytoene desaturase family protein [Saprospiraceae bacterium]